MKIEIENISVLLPKEQFSSNSKMTIRDDLEFLHFDFSLEDEENDLTITLDKQQVSMLRDALNMVIKNKLI